MPINFLPYKALPRIKVTEIVRLVILWLDYFPTNGAVYVFIVLGGYYYRKNPQLQVTLQGGVWGILPNTQGKHANQQNEGVH